MKDNYMLVYGVRVTIEAFIGLIKVNPDTKKIKSTYPVEYLNETIGDRSALQRTSIVDKVLSM